MKLQGKRAIITGGASGIGLATAKEFLREGATEVIILDKDKVQEYFAESGHGTVNSYLVDISDRREVIKIIQSDRVGVADILVNCAAINTRNSALEPDDPAWERTLKVNLSGGKYVTDAVVKRLLAEKRKGSVIFITSVHALFAFRNAAAYDVSKNAVAGLMRNYALEFVPYGIRVNAIAPGGIYPTSMTANMTPEEARERGKLVPMGRFGRPEEIATVCAFLASDEASYITGQQIVVDGGFSIRGAFVD